MGGEGVEIERSHCQGRRQFLHRVDKYQKPGDHEAFGDQRRVHAPHGRAGRQPHGARGVVHRWRHPCQTGLDIGQGDRQEAGDIGEHQRAHAAGQEESRGNTELQAHGGIEPVVEARQRDQDAQPDHSARYRVTQARQTSDRSHAPVQARAIGDDEGRAYRVGGCQSPDLEAVCRQPGEALPCKHICLAPGQARQDQYRQHEARQYRRARGAGGGDTARTGELKRHPVRAPARGREARTPARCPFQARQQEDE